jgi:hypothetical protein
MEHYRKSWKDQLDAVRGQMGSTLTENAQKQTEELEIDQLVEEVTQEVDLQERVQALIEDPVKLANDYLRLKSRVSKFEVTEGTMAFGIFDHNPRVAGNAKKGMAALVKKITSSTKVGSDAGQKFIQQLEMKYLSDDELADDFMRPQNKNKTVSDLLKKHEKRLGIKFN